MEIVIATVCIVLVLVLLLRPKSPPRGSAPGPLQLPVIGNLHQITKGHQSMCELHKKYGPIMSLRLGDFPALVVSSPEAFHELFYDKGELFVGRPRPPLTLRILLADSKDEIADVGLSVGKVWKTNRKLFVSKLMSKISINLCLDRVADEVGALISNLEALDGRPANISRLIFMCPLNMVLRTCMGMRINTPDDPLLRAIDEFFRMAGLVGIADFVTGLQRLLPAALTMQKKGEQIRDEWRSVMNKHLDEHRATLDRSNPRDFMDMMLVAHEEGQIEEEHMPMVFWDFIAAGTDTTAATIVWLVIYLANNPRVQDKLHAELDEAMSECVGQGVPTNKRGSLPYVDACIKEIMRMRPVAPILPPHLAEQDTTVMGYEVKKDTQVLINVYAMAHDPSLWDKPEEFRPERWLEEEAELSKRHPTAKPADPKMNKFIPFGGGRRSCAGSNLAQEELFLLASNLAYHFEFAPPAGVDRIRDDEVLPVTITAQPFPFEVCCRKRHKAQTTTTTPSSMHF